MPNKVINVAPSAPDAALRAAPVMNGVRHHVNRDLLIQEVTKARFVFDRHIKEFDGTLFSTFPRGCCGNASLLLGNWLSRIGLKDIKIILAENQDGGSHAWLEVNDFIIDVTADQFSEKGYGVFPMDSEYHNSYEDRTEDSLVVEGILAQSLETFVTLMEKFDHNGPV